MARPPPCCHCVARRERWNPAPMNRAYFVAVISGVVMQFQRGCTCPAGGPRRPLLSGGGRVQELLAFFLPG
jgi:hypothetical protein